MTRRTLDLTLDALAVGMPSLLAEIVATTQAAAFANIADEILSEASPEDTSHAWSRLQCIQRDAGLIPGDDEPCDAAGTANVQGGPVSTPH